MTFFLLVRMFYHWGATLDIIALAAMVAPYEHFNFIYVVPNRGGGYSWEFLLGVCRPVPQVLTLFLTKKCNFPDL